MLPACRPHDCRPPSAAGSVERQGGAHCGEIVWQSVIVAARQSSMQGSCGCAFRQSAAHSAASATHPSPNEAAQYASQAPSRSLTHTGPGDDDEPLGLTLALEALEAPPPPPAPSVVEDARVPPAAHAPSASAATTRTKRRRTMTTSYASAFAACRFCR